MSADLNVLVAKLTEKLGAAIIKLENRLGEVTLVVAAADFQPDKGQTRISVF